MAVHIHYIFGFDVYDLIVDITLRPSELSGSAPDLGGITVN